MTGSPEISLGALIPWNSSINRMGKGTGTGMGGGEREERV